MSLISASFTLTNILDGYSTEVQYAINDDLNNYPTDDICWGSAEAYWDDEQARWSTTWATTPGTPTTGQYLWKRERVGDGTWCYSRITGEQGVSAVSVTADMTSILIPTDSVGTIVTAYTKAITFTGKQGTTSKAVTIGTVSDLPTGMTTTISGSTLTISIAASSTLSADSGTISVPVTCESTLFTIKIAYAEVKTGSSSMGIGALKQSDTVLRIQGINPTTGTSMPTSYFYYQGVMKTVNTQSTVSGTQYDYTDFTFNSGSTVNSAGKYVIAVYNPPVASGVRYYKPVILELYPQSDGTTATIQWRDLNGSTVDPSSYTYETYAIIIGQFEWNGTSIDDDTIDLFGTPQELQSYMYSNFMEVLGASSANDADLNVLAKAMGVERVFNKIAILEAFIDSLCSNKITMTGEQGIIKSENVPDSGYKDSDGYLNVDSGFILEGNAGILRARNAFIKELHSVNGIFQGSFTTADVLNTVDSPSSAGPYSVSDSSFTTVYDCGAFLNACLSYVSSNGSTWATYDTAGSSRGYKRGATISGYYKGTAFTSIVTGCSGTNGYKLYKYETTQVVDGVLQFFSDTDSSSATASELQKSTYWGTRGYVTSSCVLNGVYTAVKKKALISAFSSIPAGQFIATAGSATYLTENGSSSVTLSLSGKTVCKGSDAIILDSFTINDGDVLSTFSLSNLELDTSFSGIETASIRPFVDNASSIGSATKNFKEAYIKTINSQGTNNIVYGAVFN